MMSETVALIIFLALIPLILILRKPLVAFVRGKKGELNVKLRLRMLSSEKYKIINNLFISNNGQTTQIDHVVVSEYGMSLRPRTIRAGYMAGQTAIFGLKTFMATNINCITPYDRTESRSYQSTQTIAQRPAL
ncbi:MAG: NERD domain-containing protein [Bacteroidales bacterium]|nr:NERD domain-containing protein [Bacteroidales bacterium]